MEAVLSLKGWSLVDWASMYTDLPSRMTKELVKDRTLVKTVPDETKVMGPSAKVLAHTNVESRGLGGWL